MPMKLLYQKPTTRNFELQFESVICLSGGKAGESGDPGASFDPNDDIFDGGNL